MILAVLVAFALGLAGGAALFLCGVEPSGGLTSGYAGL
jgi:hypothetical protein